MGLREARPRPDAEAARNGVITSTALKMIPPELLRFNEQVRDSIPDGALRDRKESIAANREKGAGTDGYGVLSPGLVVANADGTYTVIFGEIRARGVIELEEDRQKMKANGVRQRFYFDTPYLFPAIVLPPNSSRDWREILILQLQENEQRNDLTPGEAGRGYKKLQDDGLSVEEIAARMGKTADYVRGRLGIALAPSDVQAMAAERPDCVALVRELVRLKDKKLRAPIINKALEKDVFQNWVHGIARLATDTREAVKKYEADRRRRAAVEKVKQQQAAALVGQQPKAPQSPTLTLQVFHVDGKTSVPASTTPSGLTSRSYTTPIPEPPAPSEQLEAPTAPAPSYVPPRPNEEDRAQVRAKLAGVKNALAGMALTLSKQTAAIQDAADIIAVLITNSTGDNDGMSADDRAEATVFYKEVADEAKALEKPTTDLNRRRLSLLALVERVGRDVDY